MSADLQPSIAEFEAFFAEYIKACAGRDTDFIRGLLPENMKSEEFEFIVDSSTEFAQAMSKSGSAPSFEKNGPRYEAVFREEEDGGSSEWRVDFYFCKNRWLKYDPDAGEEDQGWPSK